LKKARKEWEAKLLLEDTLWLLLSSTPREEKREGALYSSKTGKKEREEYGRRIEPFLKGAHYDDVRV